MATYDEMRGTTVMDINRDKIGTLEDFYVDENTNRPTWITVKTGLFGSKVNFVPLAQSQQTDEGIVVGVTKDQVDNAPKIEGDEIINEGEESELYTYYKSLLGADSDDESKADFSESENGHDTSGPNTDDAMTRSEEEVVVNKETQEIGRVRLKKFIVTENVNFTVPVEREEVRVVREPITDENIGAATTGPDLSEEEHEVTLHEEQISIDKKVVPRERIRLDKDVVQDERRVDESVRKEQVDITRGDPTSN